MSKSTIRNIGRKAASSTKKVGATQTVIERIDPLSKLEIIDLLMRDFDEQTRDEVAAISWLGEGSEPGFDAKLQEIWLALSQHKDLVPQILFACREATSFDEVAFRFPTLADLVESNERRVDAQFESGGGISTGKACPKCGSDSWVYNYTQDRSADEGRTAKLKCQGPNCSYIQTL